MTPTDDREDGTVGSGGRGFFLDWFKTGGETVPSLNGVVEQLLPPQGCNVILARE